MGEANRRKMAGNTKPKPNWKRPLTKEEIRKAVVTGVNRGLSDVLYMYREMMKKV